MKKIISLFLVFVFVFSFASCTSLFGGGECEAHKDYDANMYCDLCGAVFICPDHADADENGACDTCGAAYECTGHSDANKDGKCDKCRAPFTCTQHRDIAGDGQCDKCKAMFVCAHTDSNGDGVCDSCRAHFQCPSHQDVDSDGFCDFCQAEYICEDHRDTDANGVCDSCGEEYSCPGHIDADGDGRCDECAAYGSALNEVNPKTVAAFIRAYNNSLPTKITTKTKRIIGNRVEDENGDNYTLTSSSTLVTGNIAGKIAAVYDETYQELRDVESGSGDEILGVFKSITLKKEFLQGRGVRTTQDGVRSNWNSRETNFAPTKGSIALGITENNIKVKQFIIDGNVHVMEFTVPAAHVKAVFGVTGDVPNVDLTTGEVSVVLTSNGATITSVVISYTILPSKDIPAQRVEIEVNYEYSIQDITIN